MTKSKKPGLSARRRRGEFLWGWAFLLPTIVGVFILNIFPILSTIKQSLYKTGDFGRSNIFVGLDNFERLIHDPDVWQALINTIKYGVVEVPISIALGLVLAVLLNKKIKGRTIYRTILFLPMVAAPAAIAMIWKWLYNSQFGLINHIFGTNVKWVSDPNIAIYSLAIVGIWSVIGYNMVLFLAGLQEIPKDYYEAAEIDGASGIRQFFSITVPLISPSTFFVAVTRVIAALQVFDIIYMVIDRSNPAFTKTRSLSYLFYEYTFMDKNVGYGSAVVVLLLLLILVVTVIQMIAQKKWVQYN